MEKKFELVETTTEKPAHNLAWEVHSDVMAGKRHAAMGLYEMARSLKRMRDERLFAELGYDDFPSYCAGMAQVNASQAYKYIKVYEELGAAVLQSAGNMGIEKLLLVSQLPFDEKNAALADPEKIEGMSVSELRAKLAEARGHVEQISFLTEQLEEAKETIGELEREVESTEDAEAAAARVREEYEEKLKQTKIDADAAAARLGEEYMEKLNQAKIDANKESAKEIAAIREKFAAEREEAEKLAASRAEANVRKKIEVEAKEAALRETRGELDALRSAVENAEREKTELSKKLMSSDSAAVTVKLYLQAIQDNFNKLAAFIASLDGDQYTRCRSAAKMMLDAIGNTTERLFGDEV